MLRLVVPAGLRFRLEKPIAAEIRVVRGVLLTAPECGESSLQCRLDHDTRLSESRPGEPRHVKRREDA